MLHAVCIVFFFNDTATTEIYTLSLHDALPILVASLRASGCAVVVGPLASRPRPAERGDLRPRISLLHARLRAVCLRHGAWWVRSEEHTSELQSRQYLVCRLLLEKKKRSHI